MSLTTSMDQTQADTQRWKAVRAHIAKGVQYGDKSEQHYISAGQILASLKRDHDKVGGTWAQWERLVKDRAGIGKSRASELMQIADGRKTADEVRVDTAHRAQERRNRLLSVTTEKTPAGAAGGTARSGEIEIAMYSDLDCPHSTCPHCGGKRQLLTTYKIPPGMDLMSALTQLRRSDR